MMNIRFQYLPSDSSVAVGQLLSKRVHTTVLLFAHDRNFFEVA